MPSSAFSSVGSVCASTNSSSSVCDVVGHRKRIVLVCVEAQKQIVDLAYAGDQSAPFVRSHCENQSEVLIQTEHKRDYAPRSSQPSTNSSTNIFAFIRSCNNETTHQQRQTQATRGTSICDSETAQHTDERDKKQVTHALTTATAQRALPARRRAASPRRTRACDR